MIQCSANKPICIPKARVCNGINDCGMYEDEQNCCGRAGFLRLETDILSHFSKYCIRAHGIDVFVFNKKDDGCERKF